MLLRRFTGGDVAAAVELSAEAGWNQTAGDWTRTTAIAPEGCWCVEEDGTLASTATMVSYEEDLGWVGMVLTRSTHQRRGFARQLLERLLAERPRTVKLDATEAGRPLYASLGFVDEAPIERWERHPAPVESCTCERGLPNLALDLHAFGAKRTQLLHSLGIGFGLPGAYALSRPGARARYLGPCVADGPAKAEEVIRAALAAQPNEPWYWDLLPDNGEAAALAVCLGFAPVRRLVRMRLGPPFSGDDRLVYAIAGFEFG